MIAEVEYLAVTRWHIGEGEPNNGDHRQPVNPDREDAGQIGPEKRHIAEARADQRIGQSRERSAVDAVLTLAAFALNGLL